MVIDVGSIGIAWHFSGNLLIWIEHANTSLTNGYMSIKHLHSGWRWQYNVSEFGIGHITMSYATFNHHFIWLNGFSRNVWDSNAYISVDRGLSSLTMHSFRATRSILVCTLTEMFWYVFTSEIVVLTCQNDIILRFCDSCTVSYGVINTAVNSKKC